MVKRIFSYFQKPVFLSSVLCIFLFYSGILLQFEHFSYFSLIPKSCVNKIQGKILSSPSKISNGKYYSCSFQVTNVASLEFSSSAKGKIKLFIPTELVEAYFPGKLYSSSKKTTGDGVETLFESGGIFTFTGNFSSTGFYAKQCNSSFWEKSFLSKIDYFRALCRLQFKRLMYSWGESGGLLLALLCGAKEYTNQTISENFRNAGLSHILALSGMHLSMFSAIAIFFGKRIGRKKLSFIIRIIALFCFVWFAGLSPSLLRAYICAMLTLFATMSGTEAPDMIMILCFSFLIQSIISPQDIYNVGFILSYTALAGILIFNRFFYHFYVKFMPKPLSSSLSSSTSAQIFTAPISLKLFGSFAPIGVIATSIISPFVTIFIYLGIFLIIFSLIFPFFAGYSATIMNFLYNIIKYLVAFFAQFPKWSIQ